VTIAIRAYEAADWDAIRRIHDAARVGELRATVGLEAFLELAATYEAEGLFDGDVWVAELDGAVAGFLAGTSDEITWMYIDPALQRRGVGRALVRHVLARASGPVRLEVLDGNPARAFYERLGFVVESTTTGRLAGNEAYSATGHTMVWTPPGAETLPAG
jgi:ribosomal protein S18 acetylase RimI-like enzyme